MSLRTPLYDWHRSKGATLVEFGGWMLPVRYSTITDEHQAVRTLAGLFDISHMGRLSFRGSGVVELLQYVCTNNIATMKDMQVRYSLICNADGGIRDDVLVYRLGNDWSMVVNASNRSKIVAHLRDHLSGRDVVLDDQTESTAMLACQGPRAIEQSRGMFDVDIASLKNYFASPMHYRGIPCLVSRTGYTGEDGFEVAIRADVANRLADELIARGAVPCGLGARDTLRLEAAMPLYGHELDEQTDPLQAGLGWAVKFDKGDFIGRDGIQNRERDVTRARRIGLRLEGRRAAREGAVVHKDGKPIGKVTSGTIPPTIAQPIAMAYVAAACASVGTRLDVSVGNAGTSGTVVLLPFYRRA
ncbi:MAG: glycine cleavage system aminomethyltransferase GcvT [Planctomycetia bacterium]|nr:glycine cleavage system aminomethyltransferase GcvT [Planctomycetia bacterium]